ncbi:tectonin beta-propeller repeat-containing protein-like [Pollicipes pollicipes]|uniref:tectonin beta-propeller repeat-containing protein-like n=1 Tax=Pollicipes pollicipes TaxID=41117 RepID=UPI00188539DC|nr:tectonin beta-propeller repeat-containing protein-like [Pollicipes pollicipes]
MKLSFAEESEVEDWIDTIQTACVRLRRIDGAPSAAALWATSGRGDVLVSDQQLTSVEQELATETRAALAGHQLLVDSGGCALPLLRKLERGFTDGCSLVIQYSLPAGSGGFFVNLMTGKHVSGAQGTDVALHFNPRIQQNAVVRNSLLKQVWGREERAGEQPFRPGSHGELHIICQRDHFKVLAPGLCTLYRHRTDCRRVAYLAVQGDITVTQVSYDASAAAGAPAELFWRQLGGHLRRIETSPAGVVWAIGCDLTPWVYTAATGGSQLTEHGGSGLLNTMTDTRYFYIYENQRWNPISGFSYHGLATDRPTWSDRSGQLALTKDTVLPPSRHWTWVSTWSVDFHAPGGVDEEGWQYAMDFPASYHGHRGLQDFVRRRRWYRKCQLSTCGPWEKVENVRLRDLSLQELFGEVHLWAVTSAGDVMHRVEARPDGTGGGGCWRTVSTDQPFAAVSCGGHGRVWAVAHDGTARLRYGVSADLPLGTGWAHVEAPEGRRLRQISAGDSAVWAVDENNSLYWRQEILPIFPEGVAWRHVADHVAHVSCGAADETWAVSERHGGALLRRLGVCPESTLGSAWQTGVSGCWSHVSCRGLRPAP